MDPVDRRPDAGFSLVEAVVSLAIAGILLGSVTVFVLGGTNSTWAQGRTQSAVQVALDGMETARTLRSTGLVEGRAACTSTCPAVLGGASSYLTNTQRWDIASTPVVTPTLPLPSAADPEVVDGVTLNRYFYVGRCWAPLGGGACVDTATHAPTAAYSVAFYRVVIAVTWAARGCGPVLCSYVSTALFTGSATDPTFHT